ncbi:hypothetical protein BD324DRAFT_606414 [Kockovaella imperatae]|uniref:Uncharacterized protein n=1 Tax=Kockovaella imperatae TaxID=4999 RepID=A0A1Y1UR26_9TREE|nr:hypothetical protein BD324DRAFT_606414 [Kockovaella imperatae]ORX40501.1 hypothetical protein BD324DRAFT_606414 [Kockovaella imperatae]
MARTERRRRERDMVARLRGDQATDKRSQRRAEIKCMASYTPTPSEKEAKDKCSKDKRSKDKRSRDGSLMPTSSSSSSSISSSNSTDRGSTTNRPRRRKKTKKDSHSREESREEETPGLRHLDESHVSRSSSPVIPLPATPGREPSPELDVVDGLVSLGEDAMDRVEDDVAPKKDKKGKGKALAQPLRRGKRRLEDIAPVLPVSSQTRSKSVSLATPKKSSDVKTAKRATTSSPVKRGRSVKPSVTPLRALEESGNAGPSSVKRRRMSTKKYPRTPTPASPAKSLPRHKSPDATPASLEAKFAAYCHPVPAERACRQCKSRGLPCWWRNTMGKKKACETCGTRPGCEPWVDPSTLTPTAVIIDTRDKMERLDRVIADSYPDDQSEARLLVSQVKDTLRRLMLKEYGDRI